MKGSAAISADGRYRYSLTRQWDAALPWLVFVMLNPSTADAEWNDPTVVRCINFAKRLGYGGIIVVNLFAFRATSPRVLRDASWPTGEENDRRIVSAVRGRMTVCAWGAIKAFEVHRAFQVYDMLRKHSAGIAALGFTKGGFPRHPLYLHASSPLVPYAPR